MNLSVASALRPLFHSAAHQAAPAMALYKFDATLAILA